MRTGLAKEDVGAAADLYLLSISRAEGTVDRSSQRIALSNRAEVIP